MQFEKLGLHQKSTHSWLPCQYPVLQQVLAAWLCLALLRPEKTVKPAMQQRGCQPGCAVPRLQVQLV